jgi:hypothetical protein
MHSTRPWLFNVQRQFKYKETRSDGVLPHPS